MSDWKRSLIGVVIGALMALATLAATVIQFSDWTLFRRVESTTFEENRRELARLKIALEEQLKRALAAVPERVEAVAFNLKIKALEEKISSVQQQTIGLRQAINPAKPEEILTIARLTDETRALRKELDNFQGNLAAQQKLFQDSVLREIKASNDSTNLILVVLIPLVANFLYNLWKDFKTKG